MFLFLALCTFPSKSFSAGPICTNAFKTRDSVSPKKGIEQMKKCLQEGLGCDLQRSRVYFNIGFYYWKIYDYKKAIENYTIAIKLDPSYKKAYINRSDAYKALGHEDKAALDLKNANSIPDIKHNSVIP